MTAVLSAGLFTFYEASLSKHITKTASIRRLKAHRSARGKKGAKTKRLAQAGMAARQKSMR
jgi:hypothetical protein